MAGRKGAVILDTARQMFLERGYDATSLDDVAAASGVSKTTVYNNFEDKEGLFSAVVLSVTEAGPSCRQARIRSRLGVANACIVSASGIAALGQCTKRRST